MLVNDLESEATRKLREAEEAKKAANQPPAPVPAPTVVAPQVIVEYPNDVKELLEKVRTEEKQKLYDRLKRAEAIEEKNTALTSENSVLRARTTELDAKLNAAPNQQSPATNSTPAQGISDTAPTLKRLEDMIIGLQGELAAARNQSTATTAATFRDKIIAEANGKIIPELVTGNTEEELRVSAINAKAAYERTIKSSGLVTQQQLLSNPTQVPASTGVQPASASLPAGVVPTTSSASPSATSEAENLRALVKGPNAQENYRKNRESILGKLKNIYPTNAHPLR